MGIKELTWVAERPSDSTSQFIAGRGVGRSKNEHKKVRRHAAHISATARLATVRRRNHEIIVKLVQQQYLATRRRRPNLQSGEDDPPPWFITKLLAESSWYQTAVQMNSLGQKSERNILWGALTHNTSLLQVALLAAGTNTNACGLAPGQLTHMGLGLVHLKSASLQSIQSAIEHSVRDSLTAVAIALLAAWERGTRHGEESAYQMHMSAWRCMKCPPTREEERTVDTLMHAVMQLFNEQLDEISAVAASSPSSSRARYPASLPIGFRIFSLSRPETRSLLGIVSRVARTDPTVSSSLPAVRELCIQAIGWSASHSVSVALEVCPLHEAEWDFYELQALYHIRAALISLNGILHVVTSRTHRVHWSEYVSSFRVVKTADNFHQQWIIEALC